MSCRLKWAEWMRLKVFETCHAEELTMRSCRYAKINVKVLIILLAVTVALGASLLSARQIRRKILSKKDLEAGTAAFEKQDWSGAYEHFQEYLGRNPNDIEILKKYAEAGISMRPLDYQKVSSAIQAYRYVVQVDPNDSEAYEELAMLYKNTGKYSELAYIALKQREHKPQHRDALLWLADAQIGMDKLDDAKETLLGLRDAIEEGPDELKQDEGICLRLCKIYEKEDSQRKGDSLRNALDELSRVIPEDATSEEFTSVEALVNRARLYRTMDISILTSEEMAAARADSPETEEEKEERADARMAHTKADLARADSLGTEDPQIRLLLAMEWLRQKEYDRGLAEFTEVDKLTPEQLDAHFLDTNQWRWKRYLVEIDLMIPMGREADCAVLTDTVLGELTNRQHRMNVLPMCIEMYAWAGKAPEAGDCLEEYLEGLNLQNVRRVSNVPLGYLKAVVARLDERPYAVINELRPLSTRNPEQSQVWRLLAEAYSQTDQIRRSVSVLEQYYRLRPEDESMKLALAQAYLKLGAWRKAFELARNAEASNEQGISLRLLGIEAGVYQAAEQDQDQRAKETQLKRYAEDLALSRQRHPKRVLIRILQAIIALNLGELQEAESELKLASQECDEPFRAEMQLVQYYFRTKRLDEAIRVCEEVCVRHSEISEPRLMLSSLHVANGDDHEARECLREGLNHIAGKRERRAVRLRLAMQELLHGDRVTGIDVLTKLADQDPHEIRARSLLLNVQEVQADPNQTERIIDEMRTAEGENGLLWRMYQAYIWMNSEHWRSKQQDITDYLQKCIDSDPKWSPPTLLMAKLYEQLKDFERAESICRRALLRNPSATDIADKLVILLEQQGRYPDAKQVLVKMEMDPRAKSNRFIRLALQSSEFSQAIDELMLRVSPDDRDAESRILLARLIYRQKLDIDQAMKYLDEAEEIGTSMTAVTAAKVFILRSEGRTEESQSLLDDQVARSNDFDAYLMRGSYLSSQGLYEEAEMDFKKLTTFKDQGTRGFLLLSNFYASHDKLDLALATMEDGQKAYSDDLILQRVLMKRLLASTQPEDREKAQVILGELEEKLPMDPELMYFRARQELADAGLGSESSRPAEDKLETVVKLEPTAVQAHLLLIANALEAQELEKARDYAVRALGSNPGNAPLLLARCQAELSLENTNMAIELFNLALEQDPNNIKIRETIVKMALVNKDPAFLEESRKLLESRLVENPDSENLLISHARVSVALKKPQLAIPRLEAYCRSELGANRMDALLLLVDICRLAGNMTKAQTWFVKAEEVEPNHQGVLHARFILLTAQKQYDELLGISPQYLETDVNDLGSVVMAAKILLFLQDDKFKNEAVRLYDHAARLAPQSVDISLGLASSLYQTGQPDRGAKVCQMLLKLDPKSIRIRVHWASTLYSSGNSRQAKGLYEEIYNDLDPKNIQVLNDLAWIYQELDGNYEQALTLANRGLELAMNSPSPADELALLDTRGTILRHIEGRALDAKKDFAEIISLSPNDPAQLAKAFFNLGELCVDLGDLEEAKLNYKKALENDQKNPVLTEDQRSKIKQIRDRGN